MKPYRSLAWMAAVPVFVLAASQEPPPRVTGTVEATGFTPVRIAVPTPAAEVGAAALAEQIAATVRDDLAFSGYFDVVAPELYRLVRPSTSSEIAFTEWRSIGAEALVVTRLGLVEGAVDLISWLYNTPDAALLFGHRYRAGPELVHRLAHRLADDIVRHYTGRPGIATSRIAFVSRDDGGSELYLMDYDGRHVRRLTTTGTLNLSPAWSPDGQRLAFVSWRTGRPDIFVLDDRGQLERLPVVAGEMNASPDWSPDGRRLAYVSNAPGNPEIFVLDLESGRNTRLTHSVAIETSPAFSPNGREIAFTSDRSGTPQIYLMDREGLNVRRLTVEGSYNESPAWSPRGDQLAYVSRVGGRFEIFVLDLPNGERRQLTFGPGSSENPRWSPDGRHLVFAANHTGTYDIYTMRADGTEVRRLTRGRDSVTPDWSR